MFNYESNLGKAYTERLPTLGQTIARCISLFGGKRLYGVGGDFAANLIGALEPYLELCPSSNEMHAGFSACAQAETEGMGFCLTTYTVGSLPCVSAAALAMTESLPVVFISGAPGEQEVGSLAIHHTVHARAAWRTQYDNALEAFAALGMKAERLQGQRNDGQPNMAGESFLQLLHYAWQHRQPVFIEVPRDQVFSKTQALQLPDSPSQLGCGSQLLAGSSLIADEIRRRLSQAQKPVLFIGDGVKHNPRLRDLIIAFSEKHNIPFATSWFAKGLFDEFEPRCLGAYNGVFSDNFSREYIEQHADYVMDVASSIYAQDTNTAFATGSHFIEAFANKTVLKGTALQEQDLVELFETLLTMTLPVYESTLPEQRGASVPLADTDKLDFHNLASVMNVLQQHDANPYLYLPEVGNSYFASYSLKTRLGEAGRGWLTNPWYGAMGTTLPYARHCAKLVQEQQLNERVVVITGDGGLHFQANELIEMQKDRTAVIIIYMRNNIFHLGKSGDGPIYYCNDPAFDIHKLIAAYGGESAHCQTVGEFKQVFNQYVEQNSGLKLIEIPADPDEQYQCREIRLLNMYIKAKNGDARSLQQWQALT
ncbi:thiamine pyrophosphate-dependent enzyme [Lacimicrobium sp. SS2-24]|uniref:thiamine pyrophosphate-dependent enzyme n=1 Tax=Lacimicrobium sp. SS2-24 TaxID=2005569 RepID=UPI000B4B1CD6|nr:thiamine pyrophosphate-dependent enzyme [Lacimicrobium sp. SS2-24]